MSTIPLASCSQDLSHGLLVKGAFAWETTSAVKIKREKRPEAQAVGRNAAATRAGGAGFGKSPFSMEAPGSKSIPMTLTADAASGKLGGDPTQTCGGELRSATTNGGQAYLIAICKRARGSIKRRRASGSSAARRVFSTARSFWMPNAANDIYFIKRA